MPTNVTKPSWSLSSELNRRSIAAFRQLTKAGCANKGQHSTQKQIRSRGLVCICMTLRQTVWAGSSSSCFVFVSLVRFYGFSTSSFGIWSSGKKSLKYTLQKDKCTQTQTSFCYCGSPETHLIDSYSIKKGNSSVNCLKNKPSHIRLELSTYNWLQ